jgi:hypothetical protein
MLPIGLIVPEALNFPRAFDNELLIWKENKIIVGPRVKLDFDLHSNGFW